MRQPQRLRFDEFMDEALYGPNGFYQHGGHAGRRGDFLTSPEVGPLFGAVVARYLDAEWRRLGQPAQFDVVDLGAGPGTLARSIIAATPACAAAMRYTAVEISSHQRAQHPETVVSAAELPDRTLHGVVIANELLDNLPFRLVVYDGGWREAFVEKVGDRTVEHLGAPLDPLPSVLPASARHGARAPLVDRAASMIGRVLDRLAVGSLLVFDYARSTTSEMAELPWREWLRTYRGHQRGDHYLLDPGGQDITTDVPIDQLPPADAVCSQSHWLERHGIEGLVDEGKEYWRQHAAQPDLVAMRMRSRVSEAEALRDPSGLGGFTAMSWRRDRRDAS